MEMWHKGPEPLFNGDKELFPYRNMNVYCSYGFGTRIIKKS